MPTGSRAHPRRQRFPSPWRWPVGSGCAGELWRRLWVEKVRRPLLSSLTWGGLRDLCCVHQEFGWVWPGVRGAGWNLLGRCPSTAISKLCFPEQLQQSTSQSPMGAGWGGRGRSQRRLIQGTPFDSSYWPLFRVPGRLCLKKGFC